MPDTVNLFNRVARRYDSLNTFFSMGMDRLWRRRLARAVSGSKTVLDIATGTGEVALETVDVLPEARVFGVDPSSEMLLLARKKIASRGLSERISLARCQAETLPFRDGSFDAVTIAFGIRNTVDPGLSLSEMRRVLKPGGRPQCWNSRYRARSSSHRFIYFISRTFCRSWALSSEPGRNTSISRIRHPNSRREKNSSIS
jgi:ubiquinone/menaquinone biosynthesis methyltransferase